MVSAAPNKSEPKTAVLDVGGYACSRFPVIAVCVFGLVRNVKLSQPSLYSRVLQPLQEAGETDLFVHTLLLAELNNNRSKELGIQLMPGDFLRIGRACRYTAEDQDTIDETLERSVKVLVHGHKLFDKNMMKNFLRALYGLQQVANMALAHERKGNFKYRLVCVARADTAFLSGLPPPLVSSMLKEQPTLDPMRILVPNFHMCLGVNDRFALGGREAMFNVYMQRFSILEHYLKPSMNSEMLLCRWLQVNQVSVLVVAMCVVRMRSTGVCNSRDLSGQAETPRRCMRNYSLPPPHGVPSRGNGPCWGRTCDSASLLVAS